MTSLDLRFTWSFTASSLVPPLVAVKDRSRRRSPSSACSVTRPFTAPHRTRSSQRGCRKDWVVVTSCRASMTFVLPALIAATVSGLAASTLSIAASRLAREYHRPVLLFGKDGDKASGSGRSIPALHLRDEHGLAAVEQACGVALEVGHADYRLVRRYLERTPPLTLRQVDPLIRQQTLGHRPTEKTGLGMTGNYTHTRPETQREQIEQALRRWPETLRHALERLAASGQER